MAKINFIDKCVEHTKDAESPTSYFEWAAIVSIAAVLRDRVYIKYPHYTLYPNLFVVLLSAGSSNTRKGVPLNLAKRLVTSVDNTHVISGTATMPAVIQILGEHHVSAGGVTSEGASGLLLATELTSFIKKDFDAIEKLTDLYDFHKVWEDKTKSSGSSRLERVCMSMMSGTNEALISDLYDERAQDGGLLARSCMVYEKKRRHMNSLEFDRPKPRFQYEDLVKDLRLISKYQGEFERSTESRKIFDDWYTKSLTDDKLSKSGAEGRIHDTVRKIAMILAVADLPDSKHMIITGEHMLKAIDYGLFLLKSSREFSLGTGRGLNSKANKQILVLLWENREKGISRQKILQVLLGDVDTKVLDEVIESLRDAGYVSSEMGGEGMVYKATVALEARIRQGVKGEQRKSTQ